MPDARIRNHKIHYRVTEEYAIIRPEEGCNESTTEAIAALVNSPIIQSRNLIVDLSHVEYVETPGFRWLMRQCRSLQSEGRSLIVCGLPITVERAFTVLRLDTVIPCAKDVVGAKLLLNVDIRAILDAGSKAARQACLPVVEAVRECMHLKLPL